MKNFFLIALDDHTANAMRAIGVPYWRAPDVNTLGEEDNHGISAKKYKLLLEILSLGYNVLLSDADLVFLKNPLHDMEKMQAESANGPADMFIGELGARVGRACWWWTAW